jgi:photosystem II stability/assembly factor-like uncharacterized protein
METDKGLTDRRVRALVVDPNDPNTLYVGSGDFSDESTSGGVFKSTDKGQTWFETSLTKHWVLSLAFDPKDSKTLYAGTDQGIFRSMDAGKTWVGIKTAVTAHYVLTLVVDPRDSRAIYGGTEGNSIFTVGRQR